MVLGESRFEQFQIWLDGDPQRVLHPGHAKGFKDTTVFGPGSMGHGCNWVIDGRQELPTIEVPKELGDESLLPKMSKAIKMEASEGAKPKCPSADYGMPGDSYRVSLRVTGRWRNVTWGKASSRTSTSKTFGPAHEGKSQSVSGWYLLASFTVFKRVKQSIGSISSNIHEDYPSCIQVFLSYTFRTF